MRVLRTTPQLRGFAKTLHYVNFGLERLSQLDRFVLRLGLIPPLWNSDVCRSMTMIFPFLFVPRKAGYPAYIPAIYFDKMPIAFRAYL